MSNAASLEEQWRREKDPARRAILWEQLEDFIGFQEENNVSEIKSGLYPDYEDINFLPKLMRKFEFLELKQDKISQQIKRKKDHYATGEDETFELTSTQKFLSRFLNPRTPYRSALIYHGVGVGKTCTAITIAESFLEMFPSQKILLVAPRNIQAGFRREIFDIQSLHIATSPDDVNHHKGCTKDVYLQLTNSFHESNKDLIQNRVTRMINTRYEFFGYSSFSKHVEKKIERAIGADDEEAVKRQIIRQEFSNRVLIIDEAHNLRDENLESEGDDTDDASVVETDEGKAGKQLTPFLLDVLRYAENLTLVTMTATPMYNSYLEIIFLLNLLLLNDKRRLLNESEVFNTKTQTITAEGAKQLGAVAANYVSFMRGENPLKFPIRLEPEGSERLKAWATMSLRSEPISSVQQKQAVKLPILEAVYSRNAEEAYYDYSRGLVAEKGLGITTMDKLVQVGNFIFPGEEEIEASNSALEERLGKSGFAQTFEKETVGSTVQYSDIRRDRHSSWMVGEKLKHVSAKAYLLLKRLQTCRGVSFVFSRFVDAGALAIALAMEANGYLPWGRDEGLLADGNQHPMGMQCALCPLHEKGHGTQPAKDGIPQHTFRQARYILLTGSDELSPNNAKAIQASRLPKNIFGEDIKVILGSQVTSVGLDFKFIREIFVFDSWYHLNKLDQVIGRGIRNCSHALLPENMRNCTISLLVNRFDNHREIETVDMQSYRIALSKAVSVGRVSRLLKEYALDCSLNRDAIFIQDLEDIPMRDSQGVLRPAVNRNDIPFTAMCDWLETCSYTCKAPGGMELEAYLPKVKEEIDYSTFDEFTMRQYRSIIKKTLIDLITEDKGELDIEGAEGQAFIDFEKIVENLSDYPAEMLRYLLNEMILEKERIISTKYGNGYLIYRNGYYIFQPDRLKDTRIPLAVRFARLPVPRDHYPPQPVEVSEQIEKEASTLSETEDSSDLWDDVLRWADAIRTGKAVTWKKITRQSQELKSVPVELLKKVQQLRQSVGIGKVQEEKLQMITWVYSAVKDDEGARNVLADVLCQYIWDEFITIGTQKEILLRTPNDPFLRRVIGESFWTFKGRLYIRFRNYKEDTIEYYCPNETGVYDKCSDARVADIERAKGSDPLLQVPLTDKTTGFRYGFIGYNPKVEKIVYKRGTPPVEGKKVGRGAECSITSQTTFEKKMLETFGDVLRADGKNDFGLNSTYMGKVDNYIENSIRYCTLGNLVLRYMDALRVQGKRWFFRPIESKLLGHPQVRA